MKKLLVLFTFMFVCVFCLSAMAGGLNPIGGRGSRHAGTSGALADDAIVFLTNPARLHIFGAEFADATLEVLVPRFTIEGKGRSKANVYHLLPTMGYIYPVNKDLNIGLGITVPYGFGATWDRDWSKGIVKSETLISLTNITPAFSLRLSDSLVVGAGVNIGLGYMKYKAPFDINRHFLPIGTDSSVEGWGLGATFGLEYQPTERLTLGLAYMTEMKVDWEGMTEIKGPLGLISFQDGFSSDFTFPPRLSGTLSYKFDDTEVGFSASWYGYSKTVDSIILDFHDLPLTKKFDMDWHDNYSLHAGLRHHLSDNWHISGGVGYQTSAVPPRTADQLTPDVTGWDVAAGLSYDTGDFCLNAHVVYGWGDQAGRQGTIKAETWTFGLSGSWAFNLR